MGLNHDATEFGVHTTMVVAGRLSLDKNYGFTGRFVAAYGSLTVVPAAPITSAHEKDAGPRVNRGRRLIVMAVG